MLDNVSVVKSNSEIEDLQVITDTNYFLLAQLSFLGFALYSNIGIQVVQGSGG